MQDELRVMDYYFFGIGIISLVSAFYLMLESFEFYFVMVFFFSLNFSVSFVLNIKLLKKIKEEYVWKAGEYFLYHAVIVLIVSFMTVMIIVYIDDIFSFISSFMIVNFFVMGAALVIILKNMDIKFFEKKEKKFYEYSPE
jgi:hypothetical protein